MSDPCKTARVGAGQHEPMTDIAAARAFLDRDARLLERRLAATVFDGAPAAHVVDVLRGHQNDDGGFGHALEPDTRCPLSLPVYTSQALFALVAAGEADVAMVRRACDQLASVAAPGGPVALASPVIEGYARAEHWTDWTYEPGLNPTAGIVGSLHALGVDHPWRDEAAAWCWTEVEREVPGEAHAFLEVLWFLEHQPDRARAEALVPRLAARVPELTPFLLDPHGEGYGVTPLHCVPSAPGRWAALFDDATIAGHLDGLAAAQEVDGGWPITWQPPGNAALHEWRGIETLRALRVLHGHGR
jgi:hypothetical protein